MAAFLVDASLPRVTADLLIAHGHSATDVPDIGLRSASDQDIADHARLHQLAVISGDQDFGNVVVFPPADYHGLVVIEPPYGATVRIILTLVEQFLNEAEIISNLSGRLIKVASGRTRCRPPV